MAFKNFETNIECRCVINVLFTLRGSSPIGTRAHLSPHLRLHLETHGATRRDDQRLVHLLRTHGRVQGAEEELQEAGAAELYERDELLHLRSGVLLCAMSDQVRHARQVVAHVGAHGDRDALAPSILLPEGAREWW